MSPYSKCDYKFTWSVDATSEDKLGTGMLAVKFQRRCVGGEAGQTATPTIVVRWLNSKEN
jgi:hypothetical protein